MTKHQTLTKLMTMLILTLATWTALPLTTQAQEPTSELELVGQIGGGTYAVFVEGNYAYIGVGSRLVILDISNPTNPTQVGQSPVLPSIVFDVYVSGSYAYVADFESGLQVINISNPANPTLTGSYDTPGYAQNVAVSGSYAYVADFESGLQIINISNPANPTLTGSYDTPGDAWEVAVIGSYAYLAADDLQIINISNPANPTLTGSYDTPGDARDVVVSGSYAYVADGGDGGLQIVNISNPANPTLTGSYDTPGSAEGVAVSGNYAYVTAYSGLRIINISNPANPILTGSYDTPDYAVGVAVSGSYAYVTDGYGGGLQVLDISTPNPTLTGSYDTPGFANGVAVSGSYAYLADFESGLQVINISNPANPTLTGSYDTPGEANGVAVSGSYAYVADWDSGLQIINISNPANPTLTGSYDTPSSANGVAVSGSYAYLAHGDSGLQVINISTPANPTLTGSYDTPGDARDVVVSGSYAYVADGGDGGLQIVNISNPANPTLTGSYDTPGYAWGVAVSGSYAYLADGESGLQIINISNPANPTLSGSYDTPGEASRVAVSGSYAYLADGFSGLQIINISNPANPILTGSYDTPDYAVGVAVSGSYAYLADVLNGLVILQFNESPPALSVNPPSLTFTGTPGGDTIPISQTLTITNSGSGRLNWTATVTDLTGLANLSGLITVSPLTGTAPTSLTVSVDSTGVAPGTYHAAILLRGDAGVVNSPYTVPVTVTVAANPVLAVSPQALSYQVVAGEAPISQTVSLSNTGTGVLTWTAQTDPTWLTVSPSGGTAPANLNVTLNPTTLTAGSYTATVMVNSNGGGATIPVMVTVAANPVLAVSPNTLSYQVVAGDAPISQTVSLSNTGTGVLTWTATVTDLTGAPNLPGLITVSPAVGTAPATMTVSVDSTGVAPGTYHAAILLRGDGGVVNSPYTIPVTVTVAANPVLAVSPQALSYQVVAGEAPISQTVSLSNTGTGVLTWTAQTDPTWLTVSPSGGTAPANLNVTVNPTTLTAGSYTAGLTISSNGGGATIPISVMVESNVTYSVTGQISNSLGTGVDGVVISLGRYTTTSDNAGQFSLSVPDGDYTVVISKTGYSFSGQPATVSVAGAGQALPEIIGLYTAPSVDSGFRPDPNGFKFNNFGFEDQSWQLFKQTFIDDLARIEHSNGTPKLAARAFYTATAGYWNIGRGGNCTGFANASLINFSKLNELETSEDDALNWSNEVVVYEVDGGEKKDVEPGDSVVKDYLHIYQGRQISQEHSKWWNQQGVGKTYQHYDYTPLDTLQLVKDALADFEDNPVTLAVRVSDIPCDRDKDGEKNETCTYGHRVVPYRVQRVNNNEHRIFVYDSNRPGAESYYISVFDDNSWQYDDGFSDNASRADWPTGIWQGDGELLHVKSVRANFPAHLPNYYTNLSSRRQVIDQQANLSPTLTVFPAGPVELLFSTAAGQQFGLQNGQRVTDLPGAFFSTVEAYNPDYPDLESPTIYHLPANLSYTLQAVGSGAYSMTVLGNNLALQLSGLTSTSQISLSADLRQLELATPNEQAYCYLLADDTLDQTSRAFDLCATSAGTTVISVTQDSGQLQLDNAGQATGYRLTVEQTGTSTDRQTLEGQTGADGSLTVEQAEDSTWVVDKPQQPTYLPLIVK